MLNDDICRCRDDECPERETCERWLQRDVGGSRIVACESLRYDVLRLSGVRDGVPLTKCPNRIPATQCASVRYALYEGVE